METYAKAANAKLGSDTIFIDRIRKNGIPWRRIVAELEKALPDVVADPNERAYKLVPRFLSETFGDQGWETKRQPKKDGSGMTRWVYVK
jgi:hypothetical protein